MKRTLVIIVLLIGVGLTSKAQPDKPNCIGINVLPLLSKTLEIGYEKNFSPYISCDLYTGYVFNSNMDSPRKVGTDYELTNKSGFFIKIGARYNVRKDFNKIAPFIGLNIVNALAIEEGNYNPDVENNTPDEPVKRNSYNLGLNGIIGLTSPARKRINVDIGLQIGTVLINNLLDFHSYMPGMGVDFGGGVRIQGIARIKYLIN